MTTAVSRRELFAWALALALMVTAIVGIRDQAGAGFIGPTTEVAYIATGENFPDALSMSVAAALGLGPVLLTQLGSIPAATLAELNRLQPPLIVIVGGTSVISNTVEAQLNALAYTDEVIRIAGANRYETAAEVSQATFPTSGLYPRAEHSSSDLPLSGGPVQTIMTNRITAPAPGVLIINGGADYSGAGAFNCWITLSQDNSPGDILPGSTRFTELSAGNSEENCSTEVAVVVEAGSYSVRYRTAAQAGVDIGSRSLTTIWIPFDGGGQVPQPLP